jgi:hypothetical protein
MTAMGSNCSLHCESLVTDSLNYDKASAYRLKITPKNLKIFGHMSLVTDSLNYDKASAYRLKITTKKLKKRVHMSV